MRRSARGLLAATAALACVWVSHWLMTSAPASPWNAVALLAPMLIFVAIVAWQTRRRMGAVAALVALAGLVANAQGGEAIARNTLYVVQHVAIHLGLAALFGLSLQGGREALISAVARRVHGHLSADMAGYTRKITQAWVVYFVAMALLSLALFHAASFQVWALFANWLTPVALALMFGGEFVLRYRLHPEFERATMMQAIAAYGQGQPPDAKARSGSAAGSARKVTPTP